MIFIKAVALLALPALVVAQVYSTVHYADSTSSSASYSESSTESYPEPSGYTTEAYSETYTTSSQSVTGSATGTATGTAPSAPPSTPGHINIDVGYAGTLTFNPPNITAANGTVVTFFFPKSFAHSVTQSSFGAPCTYLAASGGGPGGFDSGLTQGTQFTITITNDTEPIWYYCKQITHCGLGMVGSINAPSSGNTYDAYKAAALAIGSSETPETDNGPVTGGVGAVATATPAATYSQGGGSATGSSGTGSSSTAKPSSSSSSGERLVAGGSLDLVAAVLALAFLQI